ncbi:ParA family protein, partial [Anaerorhabdus sp.]|uniref:ParA family protein n=1 Tax=Anaerorhabdus sp. TaxID=1872524 RepID=UPI002FCC65D8
MTKVITILNIKGGVGKTTSSLNIATGLAHKGYQVCLIDNDIQASATDLCKLQHNEDLGIHYIDEMYLFKVSPDAYQTETANLHIIPSRLELATAEREILLGHEAQFNRLQKVVKKIKDKFDYIIIDCGPILNQLTVNALYCCDEVIIPLKIDKGAEKGFYITIKYIKEICESYDLDLPYRILFTAVNRNNIDKNKILELSEKAEGHVIKSTIRNQAKPITASGYSQNMVIDGSSNVGKDYECLVDE